MFCLPIREEPPEVTSFCLHCHDTYIYCRRYAWLPSSPLGGAPRGHQKSRHTLKATLPIRDASVSLPTVIPGVSRPTSNPAASLSLPSTTRLVDGTAVQSHPAFFGLRARSPCRSLVGIGLHRWCRLARRRGLWVCAAVPPSLSGNVRGPITQQP